MTTNKADIYTLGVACTNCFLGLAGVLVAVYLVILLIGGKFSGSAVIHYASWIVMAIPLRWYLRRLQHGLPIRPAQYLLVGLAGLVPLIVWFAFPWNLLLALVSGLAGVCGYRARQRPAASACPDPSGPARFEVALNAQTIWRLAKWTGGGVSLAIVLSTTILGVQSGTFLPLLAGGIALIPMWLVVTLLLRPKT